MARSFLSIRLNLPARGIDCQYPAIQRFPLFQKEMHYSSRILNEALAEATLKTRARITIYPYWRAAHLEFHQPVPRFATFTERP